MNPVMPSPMRKNPLIADGFSETLRRCPQWLASCSRCRRRCRNVVPSLLDVVKGQRTPRCTTFGSMCFVFLHVARSADMGGTRPLSLNGVYRIVNFCRCRRSRRPSFEQLCRMRTSGSVVSMRPASGQDIGEAAWRRDLQSSSDRSQCWTKADAVRHQPSGDVERTKHMPKSRTGGVLFGL